MYEYLNENYSLMEEKSKAKPNTTERGSSVQIKSLQT